LKLLIEITSEEQYLTVHLPERFRAVAPSAVLQINTLSDQGLHEHGNTSEEKMKVHLKVVAREIVTQNFVALTK